MNVTIRRPDYDEIVLQAVASHRPRPHEDLTVLDSLLAKLEALGIRGERGRLLMRDEVGTLDLTTAEAVALHALLRTALRKVPLSRARELRYLAEPLAVAEVQATQAARETRIDEQLAARRAEVRRLELEERRLARRVESLRAEDEGGEA